MEIISDRAEAIILFVVVILACVINFTWDYKHRPVTQDQPAHVCEVTQADLKAVVDTFGKKLATRDNQIEGLQRQLYDKQNGVKKK